MAIDVYDAGTGDGLFNILGKAFFAIKTLNTARLTTVPAEVQDVVTQMKTRTGASLDMEEAWGLILSATETWRTSGDTLAASLQTACQDYLKSVVALETGNLETDLTKALTYLIETAMGKTGANFYVADPNVIGCTVAANGSNHSDLEVFYSLKRNDGYTNENILAEVVTAKVSSDTNPTAPTLTFTSPAGPSLSLDEQWPEGSGLLAKTITAVDPNLSLNLVPNGQFLNYTVDSTWPDNWTLVTGTRTTHIALSAIEVQTVVIAGSPASGHYALKLTDELGNVYSTGPLAYNANSTAVQTAIQALPGFSLVTVAESGTTPNFTHTITFKGVGGNVATIVEINKLNAGTVTPSAGSPNGETETYRGRALVFIGDGATLNDVYVPLSTSLKHDTTYFLSYRVRKDATVAAGVVEHSIMNYIGGSVTTDDKGTSNSESYDQSTVSAAGWTTKSFAFRVKKTNSPFPVYLRIRLTTALTSTGRLAFNNVCVSEATALYSGGPYVGAVIGRKYAKVADSWTLTFTNSRAGELQEWFDRVFDMRGKDLLLPSAGAGTSIPDSVIG